MRQCLTYKTRKSYIDILKTVAIISVIFCHLQLNDVIGTNVWFMRCDNFIIDRLWYILGYIFANLSIPMFMLLTGANRFRNTDVDSIDYKKLLKEIAKVIAIIILFQIPFYIFHNYYIFFKCRANILVLPRILSSIFTIFPYT